MKRPFFAAWSLLFFVLLLAFPDTVFQGATSGLLLWFRTVLPTLLPFFIVSGFLIRTDAVVWISKWLSPFLCRIFRISPYGAFAMLCGFLCGYPMGAKTTADLVREEKISPSEGNYLLSFCNNASPGYIANFLAVQCLKSPSFTLPSVCLLLLVPMVCSLGFRQLFRSGNYRDEKPFSKQPAPDSGSSCSADDCIMDALENIARIGGYIMLFSILFSVLRLIPDPPFLIRLILIPSLEMTNGAVYLCSLDLAPAVKYALVIFLTSFGGFCCAAQTASVIRGTGLMFLPYMAEKLAAAVASSFLAFVFYPVFCTL